MEWMIGVGSFLAGLVSGFSLKMVIDVRSKNVSTPTAQAMDGSVAQSGNVAGGHIAAGDITTRPE
jgi:hypothetical protein